MFLGLFSIYAMKKFTYLYPHYKYKKYVPPNS